MCAAWYLSLKKRINHPAMFEPNDYLQNVPWDYKANQAFKNWLHDVAYIDTKRCIVESVEKRIKSIVGQRGVFLPHIDEKSWNVLKVLIKIRQTCTDIHQRYMVCL